MDHHAPRLLSLPAEIRSLIYTELFLDSPPVIPRAFSVPEYTWVNCQTASILLTCRICYFEAKPFFFELVQFYIPPVEVSQGVGVPIRGSALPRIVWSADTKELASPSAIKKVFGENRHLVRRCVYDRGNVNNTQFMASVEDIFPGITSLTLQSVYCTTLSRLQSLVKRFETGNYEWTSWDKRRTIEGLYPPQGACFKSFIRLRDASWRARVGCKVCLRCLWMPQTEPFTIQAISEIDLEERILRVKDVKETGKVLCEIPQLLQETYEEAEERWTGIMRVWDWPWH